MHEYMVADTLISDPVISDFTLAWFEDTGWYTANYDYATKLQWGKSKGSNFITNTLCPIDSDPDNHDEFCVYKANEVDSCGYTKTYKGKCVNDTNANQCQVVHATEIYEGSNPAVTGDCRGAEEGKFGFYISLKPSNIEE
jgi:hypothetical protein